MRVTQTLAARNGRQQGFSLVELMVAVTISLLIMAAILTLFLDVTRTNDEMAKTNLQIENGRFAIQVLKRDLIHAGFWNGYIPEFDDLTEANIPTDTPTAVPDPCKTYASWTASDITNLLGISVQAYEDPPASCTLISNKKASTDILVVRHAETCVPGVGSCEADTAGKLYFQTSLCDDDAARYVLGTGGFNLHKRTIPVGATSCNDAASTFFAEKRKFNSSIYYIRDDNTLMRSQFDLAGGALAHQPAQPLIEGVEGFRVEFGVDSLSKTGAAVNYAQAVNWADPANRVTATNRGNGSPDGAFVRCTTASPCTAAQLTDVVTAKVYVLVRSLVATPGYSDGKTYNLGSTTLGPFNDGFKRHLFSSTIRLNNVSARRETP